MCHSSTRTLGEFLTAESSARHGLEQSLDARDVADGFRQCARQLLNAGIAIEFERIEVCPADFLFLMFVQDLRFGLELQFAELVLQSRHRPRQFRQVEFDRIYLLLESRTKDADFAGVV